MTPISQDLIEKALALCGKTIYDIEIERNEISTQYIEFFFYYLLSPEFIEKYTITLLKKDGYDIKDLYLIEHNLDYNTGDFGKSIRKFQSGDSKPLEELLSKI